MGGWLSVVVIRKPTCVNPSSLLSRGYQKTGTGRVAAVQILTEPTRYENSGPDERRSKSYEPDRTFKLTGMAQKQSGLGPAR
jgi:hypothetical protein